MSIVNNANPGSSILILSTIDQYLLKHRDKPITIEKLKQQLRPETLAKTATAAKRFQENLDFWLKLDLWGLDTETQQIFSQPENEKHSLAFRVLKKIIASTDNPQAFFEGSGVEPFILTLTCLIQQDRYTFFGGDRLTGGSSSNVSSAVNQYAMLQRVVNQSNEAGHFIKWAEFLGFLEPDQPNQYILDPTRAILPYLEIIFAEQHTLPIQTFLRQLAEYLPMFNHGRFAAYLADVLREPVSEQQHQVSAALSHALLRLELMNKIKFDRKSDDSMAMQLVLPQGMPVKMVSTISFRNVA